MLNNRVSKNVLNNWHKITQCVCINCLFQSEKSTLVKKKKKSYKSIIKLSITKVKIQYTYKKLINKLYR